MTDRSVWARGGGNPLTRSVRLAAISVLLAGSGGWACAAEPGSAPTTFPVASVRFEQNATDEDSEVVFDVKGGKDGLAELTVVSPDGRTVVAFKAPDASTLGMRQFRFESPEPTDIKSLKAAYPQGTYRFSGKTITGATLTGEAKLSHELPATTTVLTPAPNASNVAATDLKISWRAVKGVASYLVGIKQPESNANFTAQVPASARSFAVPAGFLVPGKKYKVSVGTVTAGGNTSFVETTFTTAK
jgi:hypothetical protein